MAFAEAVSDTLAHQENIGDWIQHHIENSPEWSVFGVHVHLPHFEPLNILGTMVDFSITKHVLMIWFAAFFILMLFMFGYNSKKKVPSGIGAILEIFVLYVRDEIAVKSMGEKEGRYFTPLLVSFFFFVLMNNLMGLVPLFSAATGNINVTAALAIVTFLSTQVYGIKVHGLFGYYKGLVPPGVPILLWPLMFVIEIMGLIAKHVALTIRLFANMVAGHVSLFAFLGLTIILKSIYVSPASVGFAIFIYFIEILVAFIQAYIFTLLSAIFIGMSLSSEH
jgi:F-type H+-transporting ATPase subunit a